MKHLLYSLLGILLLAGCKEDKVQCNHSDVGYLLERASRWSDH